MRFGFRGMGGFGGFRPPAGGFAGPAGMMRSRLGMMGRPPIPPVVGAVNPVVGGMAPAPRPMGGVQAALTGAMGKPMAGYGAGITAQPPVIGGMAPVEGAATGFRKDPRRLMASLGRFTGGGGAWGGGGAIY